MRHNHIDRMRSGPDSHRRNRCRPQVGRGFTLIELMVVMMIVGVMIGLVIPALAGVRHESRRTQCMSNLRSLNQAMRSYMDTENRSIFPVTYGYLVPWRNESFVEVYSVIESHIGAPLPSRVDGGERWAPEQPFICPADTTVAWEFGYSYYFWPGRIMMELHDPESLRPEVARRLTMRYEAEPHSSPQLVWMDCERWHPGGAGAGFRSMGAYFDGSVDWAGRWNRWQ